jgi:RNA polymerase sigma-70 factor, ECF subfamily
VRRAVEPAQFLRPEPPSPQALRDGDSRASFEDVSRSDDELLEAARQGDRRAMEDLLARYEKPIYRFGLRMCGHEEDARDVLQETLLAAFRNLPQFRGDAALSTWLYQIARSFCTKLHRRGRGETALDEQALEATAPQPGPEGQAQAREIGLVLAAAIRALSPDHREALVLRDVEGLSAEQAAEVVGVEVGALKSRLHRARAELRTHLATLLGDRTELGGPEPCPELAQEISAYAASEIDQATCVKIEDHLTRCPRCAGACEALKRTVSLCSRIPGDEVPAPVRAAVRRALVSLLPA